MSPTSPESTLDTAELVSRLCRHIEASAHAPSLGELAALTPWSASRLHRVFKASTGLTPHAYAQAQRAQRVRSALAAGQSVTEAIYTAGYSGSGRFYEAADQVLGMTPSQFRAKAARLPIRFAVGQCSLGAILVAQSTRGVCAILMGEAPEPLVRDLQDRFPQAELIGAEPGFEQVVAMVVGFVEQPGLGLSLPLDIRGTAFQQRVWQALQAIPPGQTLSYTEVAERLGAPKAVRAVAGACAANALAVAIPCHRVVRHDGGLSGYRWGVERKRALLEREAKAGAPLDAP
jgi:AraC family transcriptional regulator of adaptative response/methylated-DNA-[protein]-cysteine methyltransferase